MIHWLWLIPAYAAGVASWPAIVRALGQLPRGVVDPDPAPLARRAYGVQDRDHKDAP